MASFKSNYLKNKLNDHEHGGPDYTRPATTYLALMTTAPNADNVGGVEGTGTGTARLAVTNNNTNWPASSAQRKANGTKLDWGTCTVDEGPVVGVAEFDQAAGGNLLNYVEVTPQTVTARPVAFEIGALVFSYQECS